LYEGQFSGATGQSIKSHHLIAKDSLSMVEN